MCMYIYRSCPRFTLGLWFLSTESRRLFVNVVGGLVDIWLEYDDVLGLHSMRMILRHPLILGSSSCLP